MPETKVTNDVCVCVCIYRALCYLKLERFTEAKQDCDAALKLEPTNKKAFYRRALANKGLKVNRASYECHKGMCSFKSRNYKFFPNCV